MKKKLKTLSRAAQLTLILCGLVIGYSVKVIASTVWAGSFITVNNTTYNSPTNAVSVFPNAPPNVIITLNSNLARVTDATFAFDESLDGTNFVNVAMFNVPATNAGSYPWSAAPTNVPVYGRYRIITTNNPSQYSIFQP